MTNGFGQRLFEKAFQYTKNSERGHTHSWCCGFYLGTRQPPVFLGMTSALSRLLVRGAQRNRSYLPAAAALCRCASTSSAPAHTPEQHDIVILGGGVVGLALASALSARCILFLAFVHTRLTIKHCGSFPGSRPALSNAYKITLLDIADLNKTRAWQPKSEGQYENRCSSITNQSKALLEGVLVVPVQSVAREMS